jgi:hypothetical protein
VGISRQSLMRARQSGRCGQSRDPEVLRRELAASRSARDRYQAAAAEEKELRVQVLKPAFPKWARLAPEMLLFGRSSVNRNACPISDLG